METLLLGLFCILATLFCVVTLTPLWIRAAKKAKIIGKDLNKYAKPDVADAGGIAIILSIVFGLLLLVFIKTFILHTESNLVSIFGIIATVLLAGFLGFVDTILGWLVGIGQWYKILLTIPMALPLMVINHSHSTINLPFFGAVNMGYAYPLLIVPIGIIGSANGFNLVAGYNGLEAGLGAIILSALGAVAYFQGTTWLALVCFVAVAALIGFLLFNYNPAKVFISDAGTYAIGALIGAVAILGNMEKLALFMFFLYFVDIILYLKARIVDRAGFVQAFGIPNRDNSLELPYSKLYDSTHIVLAFLKKIRGKVYETDIVVSMWFLQVVICLLALVLVW